MRLRILLASVLLTASAWAGIVDDVRLALSQNSFSAAESALNSYRGQQGVTAEYLEAYSWLGRAALEQGQYDRATAYAKETQTLALAQLKLRPFDAEPHLPMALGAAFEVQSQALAARGQRTQAVASVAERAANLRDDFHSRSATEELEPAFVPRKDGARAEG